MDSHDRARREGAAAYLAAIVDATSGEVMTSGAARLGDALRQLSRAVVGSGASDAQLHGAAAVVERLVDELAPHARSSRYEQAAALSSASTFANHPMIGPANSNSPRIQMEPDGERLVGHVTFATPQEGPPNCAYGGYIAAGFDAILLMTAGMNGLGGPTKSMQIRYRKATPLNQPLRYVGEIEGVDDRVTKVRGRLMAGDMVCAEGTAEAARTPLRHA